MMDSEKINSTVSFLIERRCGDNHNRLPHELIPTTSDEAFSTQMAIHKAMGDEVGGWKTGLPLGDKLIVAPIPSNKIHESPVCPARPEKGVCRIEPEIAFQIGENLPPRLEKYTEEEIKKSIVSAFLAIEMIENRYQGNEEISHNENLADCLFNQGICLGPEIPVDQAISCAEVDIRLTQNARTNIKGVHPNKDPLLPLFWLCNFLREQNVGLKTGDVVITGSYAGVLEVEPNREFKLEFSGLGAMTHTLTS